MPIDVEILPGERQCGVLTIHEVQLEGDENLMVGSRLTLRDEGGWLVETTVEAITLDQLGPRYRLRMDR